MATTDWSNVNRIIEKITGKPTPTREEISAKVAHMIEKLHTDLNLNHSVHNGFCYTCQKWL